MGSILQTHEEKSFDSTDESLKFGKITRNEEQDKDIFQFSHKVRKTTAMKTISQKQQSSTIQRQLPRILRRGPPVPKRNHLLAYLAETVEKKKVINLPETSLNINLFDDSTEVACGDVTLKEEEVEEPRNQGIDLPSSANEDLCLVTEKEFSLLHKSFLDEFVSSCQESVQLEQVGSENNNNNKEEILETADETCEERSSPLPMKESPEKSSAETISIKTELIEAPIETFEDFLFLQESTNPPSKELQYTNPCLTEESSENTIQPCAEESSNISVHENAQENDLPVEDTCPSTDSSFICLEFEPVEIREETPVFPQESINSHSNELIDSEKRSNEEEIPEITAQPCTESSVPTSMEEVSSEDLSYIQDEDSCSSSESSFSCLEFEPIVIHEDSDLEDSPMQTVFSTPESELAKILSQSDKEETCSKVESNDYSVSVTDDEKELELNSKPSSLQQRTKHSFEDSSPPRARRRSELNTSLEGSFRQLRSQGQIQDNHTMSLRRRSKFSVDQKKYTRDNTRSSEKSQPRNKHVTRTMKTRNGGLRRLSVYQEQEPVTRNRKPSCDICGEKMESSKQLKAHLNSVHKDLAKCTICKANFGDHEQLKRHMLFKHTVDPVSCPICGKQFLYKTSLKNHEMIHSNLKPFKCPDCGRGFNDSSSCRRHKRVLDIPMEQKNGLKCDICGQSFSRLACINYHRSINCE